jgi:hypothetical protein
LPLYVVSRSLDHRKAFILAQAGFIFLLTAIIVPIKYGSPVAYLTSD